MSVERVGGVEPETVDEFLEDGQVVLWRVREKGASEDEWSAWTDFDFESSHEFYDRSMVEVEEVKFVPLSALRLVEEELRQAREEYRKEYIRLQRYVRDAEADRDRLTREIRQAREGLAQAHDHITAMENGQHPSHTWVHPEDMPCPDGRHLRYVEHVTKLSWLTDWEWQRQRADRAEADLDRLADTLLTAHEFIESTGSWVGCHPDEHPQVLAEVDAALAALSPVQGEHEQDGEDAEERYDRMMRERGFVSDAAALCDPDWDEPSDGDDDDSEATR